MKNNGGVSFGFIAMIYLLTRCFGLFFLQANFLNYLFVPILLYFLFRMRDFRLMKRLMFVYVLLIIIACIASRIVHKQDIIRCFINSCDYLGILGFCIPAYYGITAQSMKDFLKSMAVTFCVCYLIQWLIYPILIWGSDSNVNDVYRMRLPGCILSYFLIYCGINDYIYTKKKSNLFLCCLGFFPVIIMGFRSLTILVVLFTFLYPLISMRKFGNMVKVSMIFGILAICLLQTDIVQSKLEEMANRTEAGGTYADSDYIRYLEYDYLTSNIFSNNSINFVGNGTPLLGSRYAGSLVDAQTVHNVYWVDLGLVGLSFIIGVPAVILLVFLILRSVWINRDKDCQFYRLTLITALIPSFFTLMEVFRSGNMLIIGLILYTIEKERLLKQNVL